jgi:putative SOS response-associated peptidase YedK
MINARSETVAEKPAFRRAFSRRRCLIPVDGFYEWRRDGGRRRPYWFHAPERRPFALAGLWERWQNPTLGEPLESCAILTTAANAVMQPIHDRMPVILSPSAYGTWLATAGSTASELQRLLRPCPDDWLRAHAVTPRVNRPAFDEPACVEPIPEEEAESTDAADPPETTRAARHGRRASAREQIDLFGGGDDLGGAHGRPRRKEP